MDTPHPADRDDLSHKELRDILAKLCETHPTNFMVAARETQREHDFTHPECLSCGKSVADTVAGWLNAVIPEYWDRKTTETTDLSEMMEKILDAAQALEDKHGGAR